MSYGIYASNYPTPHGRGVRAVKEMDLKSVDFVRTDSKPVHNTKQND